MTSLMELDQVYGALVADVVTQVEDVEEITWREESPAYTCRIDGADVDVIGHMIGTGDMVLTPRPTAWTHAVNIALTAHGLPEQPQMVGGRSGGLEMTVPVDDDATFHLRVGSFVELWVSVPRDLESFGKDVQPPAGW